MLTQQDLQAISHLLDGLETRFDEKLVGQETRFDEKLVGLETRLDEKIDKKLDEKLDARFKESESMLLDEIDRYYNLNKNAIADLSKRMDHMQNDIDILKNRSNVNDMYKITNNHEMRLCALEQRIS